MQVFLSVRKGAFVFTFWGMLTSFSCGSLANETRFDSSFNAHTQKQGVFSLDGRAYTREEIILDFTHVAFSDAAWLGNGMLRLKSGEEDKKSEDRWVNRYSHRQEGDPKLTVVNKWTNPPEVSIGWPVYEMDWLNDRLNAKFYPQLEAAILKSIPAIQSSTGMHLIYKKRNEETESGDGFAKIRVIPFSHSNLLNNYKIADILPDGWYSENPAANFISSLKGGVRFTPDSRSQVDGFILPNADNTIGLAVCRVNMTLDQKMIENLVAECLLRSLGLPELRKGDSSNLLSAWNAKNDAHGKIPANEGLNAFRTVENRSKALPVDQIDFPFNGDAIPAYDSMITRMLYCKEIKPGMGKQAVIDVLQKTDACFNQGAIFSK